MTATSNNDIAHAIYLGTKDKQGQELTLYFKDVVKFLAKNRLIPRAPEILLKIKKIIDDENGIILAEIRSATNLATQTKHHLMHSLMKRYRAKNVEIKEVVDRNLLGGLRIEVDGELIDLSIKNKIGKLQEFLISGI